MKRYRALIGFNYRDGASEKRINAGEDVPASVVKRFPSLLEKRRVEAIETPDPEPAGEEVITSG